MRTRVRRRARPISVLLWLAAWLCLPSCGEAPVANHEQHPRSVAEREFARLMPEIDPLRLREDFEKVLGPGFRAANTGSDEIWREFNETHGSYLSSGELSAARLLLQNVLDVEVRGRVDFRREGADMPGRTGLEARRLLSSEASHRFADSTARLLTVGALLSSDDSVSRTGLIRLRDGKQAIIPVASLAYGWRHERPLASARLLRSLAPLAPENRGVFAIIGAAWLDSLPELALTVANALLKMDVSQQPERASLEILLEASDSSAALFAAVAAIKGKHHHAKALGVVRKVVHARDPLRARSLVALCEENPTVLKQLGATMLPLLDVERNDSAFPMPDGFEGRWPSSAVAWRLFALLAAHRGGTMSELGSYLPESRQGHTLRRLLISMESGSLSKDEDKFFSDTFEDLSVDKRITVLNALDRRGVALGQLGANEVGRLPDSEFSLLEVAVRVLSRSGDPGWRAIEDRISHADSVNWTLGMGRVLSTLSPPPYVRDAFRRAVARLWPPGLQSRILEKFGTSK